MIGMLFALLLAYLVAAWLGGIGGVLLLAAIGVAGTAVMVGAESLHEWRAARAERATVYRRFRAWEFQDWLRRHTDWRS
jgi:ABC-type nickel/cobalt efflux system permease component RcnA